MPALPPGAELVDQPSVKLPPGATLVTEAGGQAAAQTPPTRTQQALQGAGDVISGIWKTATRSDETQAAEEHFKKGEYAHGALKLLEASLPGYSTIVKPAIDQALTAYQMGKAGRYSEAVGHGLAAVTPGGPMAAGLVDTALGEPEMPPGQQVRPVTPPQPYRAAGQALTTAAIGAVPKLVGAVRQAAANSGAPEALQASAEKQYGQVLNPTTRGNKARTARVAPELIERGVKATSLKSLGAKAVEGMSSAAQALDDAYANLPPGSSVPLKDVQARIIESANEAFTVPTEATTVAGIPAARISPSSVADAGIQHATDIADRLIGVAKQDAKTGELVIPVERARQLRQFYDGIAQQAGRYDGKALAEHSTAAAHGMAADAIREQLNKINTGDATLGDLNKEYSFWADVNRVTQDTLQRREGQAKPLGRKLASAAGTGAGFVTGGVHGAMLGRTAMDMIEKATTSPWWGTTSAVLKSRLADAIAKGQTLKVSLYAGQIASGTAAARGLVPVRTMPLAAQNEEGQSEQVARK